MWLNEVFVLSTLLLLLLFFLSVSVKRCFVRERNPRLPPDGRGAHRSRKRTIPPSRRRCRWSGNACHSREYTSQVRRTIFIQSQWEKDLCIRERSLRETEPLVVTFRTEPLKSVESVNPLPPSDAVRKQKNLLLRIFSVQYYHNLKNTTPLKT